MQPEQQTPSSMYGPSQSPQPGMQPSSGLSSAKKKVIIGCFILLVIIILASVLAGLGGKKKNTSSNTSQDDSIYHFREGYDIKEYGSSIGDPLALDLSKYGKPFTSTEGPLVFACNVLTINDLRSQKAYVRTNSAPTPVERTFIDGVGTQNVLRSNYTLPSTGDDSNSCDYALENGNSVNVVVYQKQLVDKGAIDEELSRYYDASTSVGGLTTYRLKAAKEFEDSQTYMLVKDADAVEVRLDAKKLTDAQRSGLLQAAAKNFVDLYAHPKGPAITAYNTPTFKKSYAKACDLITNDDIKNLTGSNASIFATEGLATGTGVHKVDNALYNSIDTSCKRYNTGLGSGLVAGPFDQQLDLTVTSYQSDVPAKRDISTRTDGGSNKMSGNFGDEGYGYKNSADQNTIVFRQGRFVVEVVFDLAVQQNAGLEDTAAMTQKLTPYAQAVAAKLRQL